MTVYAMITAAEGAIESTYQLGTIHNCGYKVDEVCYAGIGTVLGRVVKGDTILCTKVSCLGRTALDVSSVVNSLTRMGVKVRVMQFDGVDITSSIGKLVLTVMAAVHEMEEDIKASETAKDFDSCA